jgi:hypothetical protein
LLAESVPDLAVLPGAGVLAGIRPGSMLGLGSVGEGLGGVSAGDGFETAVGAGTGGDTRASLVDATVVSTGRALESAMAWSEGVEAALSLEGGRSPGLEHPAAEKTAKMPVRNKTSSLRRRDLTMCLSLLHGIIQLRRAVHARRS